jgi:hypothetical protein
MVPLTDLWLPILVAAVLVFVASSIVHMVLGYHKSDYKQLPNESELLKGLREAKLEPGNYHFPYCRDPKDMSAPEMQEKYRSGPVGFVNLFPNQQPAMGKYLGQWFGFCLLASVFVAYLTGRTVATGVDYLAVFRIAGTAAFMCYGMGAIINSIWKGQLWSVTAKELFDGLLYACVTAGAFGWLWPR